MYERALQDPNNALLATFEFLEDGIVNFNVNEK